MTQATTSIAPATSAPKAAASARPAAASGSYANAWAAPATGRALAVLRIATGFIFLWTFLDKAFGLGFSTPAERAWINGGTPSQGYLGSDGVSGPLKPFFAGIASPATDVLFMLGILGVGLAVVLGIGLRVSAVAGSAIMVLLYLAAWPFAGSDNPLVDQHVIYALALIVIATTAAGDTWGFGLQWKKLPIVRAQKWLW